MSRTGRFTGFSVERAFIREFGARPAVRVTIVVMPADSPKHHPTPDERDERFTLPLEPEKALRGLLAVKPVEAAEDEPDQANSEG
jgi:hypothetical protein